MKVYSKGQIVSEARDFLEYYKHEKECLDFAHFLLNKVKNDEEIVLTKEEISTFLFRKDSNKIIHPIFWCLGRLNADLSGVNFDGKDITCLDFSNLEGVVINLDKISEKNLHNTTFKGVTLTGTLDNAILDYTDFTGYIGNICLNPQKVKNKSMEHVTLSGITIDGSFDNVAIRGVDFSNAKGTIRINPQKIPDKELIGINFSNAILCGESNTINYSYVEPSFEGCKIYNCKFNNAKNKLTINLDLIDDSMFPKLSVCDLTGVTITGTAHSNYEPRHCVREDGKVIFSIKGDDLFGSYYFDEEGNYTHIYLYQSMKWHEKERRWKYLERENEQNLKFTVVFKNQTKSIKQKFLSLFRKQR